MTRVHEPVREIDLHAYADGLLDADPGRRDEVERYLATHPEAADYVAEIRAQNEAIHAHFDEFLSEPVPDRLAATLHGGPRPLHRKPALQAAVVAALVVASTVVGWLAGQNDEGRQWALGDFVERAITFHDAAPGALAAPASAGTSVVQPLGWLNQRIALELKAPDLTEQGFSLMAKDRLGPKEDAMVRLVYKRPDNTTINLFLRPRWEDSGGEVARSETDDVTAMYWLDGPLAFAMTVEAANPETDNLVRVVRQAIGRARLNEEAPAMVLTPRPGAPMANDAENDRTLVPAPRPASDPKVNGEQLFQVN